MYFGGQAFMNSPHFNSIAEMHDKIDWKALYDIDLHTGYAQDPKSFCILALEEIRGILPHDQAMILFFDGNGNVSDKHLVNIKEDWVTMYLEYYANLAGGNYGHRKDMDESTSPNDLNISRDWSKEPLNEFIRDYIRTRGLCHSLGFGLYDRNGLKRVLFAFDRTTDTPYTLLEKIHLYLLKPLLNNQFKKYYYRDQKKPGRNQAAWASTGLTSREIEVADLLCQGISPSNISRILHISKATAYKHIAHIYEKLNVSSKQELLVKLLQ